jgi:ribosomal protein S18 acetylase RimI-like enzyme
VHGLGVLPSLRRTGAGTALTAALTRAAFAGGASWVSLGMYARNDAARRIYRRLGFDTDMELRSFSPAGAQRPPA